MNNNVNFFDLIEPVDLNHANDNLPRYGDGFDYQNQNSSYLVYCHICQADGPDFGKTYIGVTNNIKSRWRKNGVDYKKSKVLYKDFQKYGWDSFKHLILVNHLTLSMASELEKLLIEKYNTNYKAGGWGYNATRGGLGKPDRYDNIKIFKVNINGDVVRIYNDVYQISTDSWVIEAIIKSCKQRKNSFMYKGCLWFFEHDFNEQNLKKRLDILTYAHLRHCDDYAHKGGVIQYDFYNNVIAEYKSPTEAAEKTEIDSRFIVNVCLGKSDSAHGYQWRYKNDQPPNTLLLMHIKIAKIDIKTNKILEIFDNQREAAASIKKRSNVIISCAKGQSKSYLGYKWRYLDENNNIIEPEDFIFINATTIRIIKKNSTQKGGDSYNHLC